jgi:hypothetical protein
MRSGRARLPLLLRCETSTSSRRNRHGDKNWWRALGGRLIEGEAENGEGEADTADR